MKDIRKFMIQWNNRFPVDRWWRKKHNIPFLSEEHKKQSFLNQVMEYEEDCFFQERRERLENIDLSESYAPNIGDFFKTPIMKEVNSSGVLDENEIEEFRKFAKELEEKEIENGPGEEDKDNS